MNKPKDYTGQEIGNLTVISKIGKVNKQIMWRCKFKPCGHEFERCSSTLALNLKHPENITCSVCRPPKGLGNYKEWPRAWWNIISTKHLHDVRKGRRKMAFTIPLPIAYKVWELQGKIDPYNGDPLIPPTSARSYDGTMSLDRTYSDVDYLVDNFAWVTLPTQSMKGDQTPNEYRWQILKAFLHMLKTSQLEVFGLSCNLYEVFSRTKIFPLKSLSKSMKRK